MHVIRGMVEVLGTTYRIIELHKASYEIVRIHDDVRMGGFSCAGALTTTPLGVDAALMKKIASAAVRQGKTSWLGLPKFATPAVN